MRPSTLFICKRRTGPAIGALDLGASRGRVNLPRTLFWGMFILTIGVVGHREKITRLFERAWGYVAFDLQNETGHCHFVLPQKASVT